MSIQEERKLPNADFARAWSAIKLDPEVRERILAQALLSLSIRSHFDFETIPLHGLILLEGVPGTGKTTLARGLANRVAELIKPQGASFVEINPHAMTSSSLGRSQREVARLFSEVIPERAAQGPCIVLLDEIESIAADRRSLSLEANPIDVHRATDAALSGIDLLARNSSAVLILATTNFVGAVDEALLSRADWIESIALPNAGARAEIILDVLNTLSKQWPSIGSLSVGIKALVASSEGLDGRRLRKAIISAGASSVATASDLNKLTVEQVARVLGNFSRAGRAAKTERIA